MKINISLHELKDLLERGEITSKEIVSFYLERIDRLNPKINAYLYVNREEALREAEIKDEERAKGKAKGLLHGLPIALKDNMACKGMPLTNASKLMEGFIAPYDAFIVKRIKEEGGIILGKLNMDEFAMGSTNEFSAFGPVKNPWDFKRVPGGSSGGSAACVSAMLAPIALGTDTGGSVRQPAAFNSIIGLKPTYGRISRYGITAFGSTLDQVGILARNTEDTALMLKVLAGYDKNDNTSLMDEVPDYLSQMEGDIKDMKIAVPVSFLNGLDQEMRENFEGVLEKFKALGAKVYETDLELAHYSLAVYYIVASAEASSNLARFDGIRFGKRAKDYDDIKDLYMASRSYGFGDEVKRRIMLGTYVLSAGYYDAFYNTALKVRSLIKEDFKRAFSEYDAVICPTTPILANLIGDKPDSVVDTYLNDLYTVPANIAGIPAISVPSGFINGLPLAFQLMGNHLEEGKILKLARAFERANEYKDLFPEGVI